MEKKVLDARFTMEFKTENMEARLVKTENEVTEATAAIAAEARSLNEDSKREVNSFVGEVSDKLANAVTSVNSVLDRVNAIDGFIQTISRGKNTSAELLSAIANSCLDWKNEHGTLREQVEKLHKLHHMMDGRIGQLMERHEHFVRDEVANVTDRSKHTWKQVCDLADVMQRWVEEKFGKQNFRVIT